MDLLKMGEVAKQGNESTNPRSPSDLLTNKPFYSVLSVTASYF